MTRIERLPGIVTQGLLPDREVLRRGYGGIEIGYRHIKDRRARRLVPCGAGGSLADYVPFYYAPRSPMLFAIAKGRVGSEAANLEEIVYLQSSMQKLRHAGLSVVASNRHAELAYVEFSDDDARLDGDEFVNWPIMEGRYWNNTEMFPDRKERRQAECLVHPAVPWDLVDSLTVKTNTAAARAAALLADSGVRKTISVRPDWYF